MIRERGGKFGVIIPSPTRDKPRRQVMVGTYATRHEAEFAERQALRTKQFSRAQDAATERVEMCSSMRSLAEIFLSEESILVGRELCDTVIAFLDRYERAMSTIISASGS